MAKEPDLARSYQVAAVVIKESLVSSLLGGSNRFHCRGVHGHMRELPCPYTVRYLVLQIILLEVEGQSPCSNQ